MGMLRIMAKAGLVCWTAGMAGVVLAGSDNSGSVDSGGQRVTSANYAAEGSLGGIVGAASNASGAVTAKSGYIGQLTVVTQLILRVSPATINEGASAQAAGVAALDDGTFSVLAGSNIQWLAPAFPLTAVSSGGQATAAAVWSNTTGWVTGRYFGVTGAGEVRVADSEPDNFGIYGADGIPDGWQVRWFGTNNPLGLAATTNSAGQGNRYAYVADLNPTNPASVFKIVGLSNGVSESIVFFTSSSNRSYLIEWTTNLQGGVWERIPGAIPEKGNGGIFPLRNTYSVPSLFYRIQVLAP